MHWIRIEQHSSIPLANFQRPSEPKRKVFNGPQICTHLHDEEFHCLLHDKEKAALIAFKLVMTNVLGNTKADNYKNFLESLQAFKNLGCNTFLEISFLHQDFFPPNRRAVSDEHREQFHQDIVTMEKVPG